MRFGAPNMYSEFNSMSYGWSIASIVLAIVGGILVLLLFLNKSNKNKYEGNLKRLYDFLNFDYLTLDIVIKFLYTATTIFIVLNSFNYISENFLNFVLYLIVGVVVTRITYELVIIFIKVCKNTTEINEKLNKKSVSVAETKEESKKKK